MPAVLRNHHVLAVHDLAGSARFLCDVLGFRVVDEPPGWIFVEREQCLLMLGACPDAPSPRDIGDHSYAMYLVVDDARAMHEAARAKGGGAVGALEEKPWGFREFLVRTPEGHRIVVGERIGRAPPPSFARSWLDAFNAKDLDAIMAHYAEDVEHSSPTVVRVLGEPTGVVRGKPALRAYFEKALAAAGPDLRYELLRAHVGVAGVTLVYHRSGGKVVAETFHFDDAGRVRRAFVAHAEP